METHLETYPKATEAQALALIEVMPASLLAKHLKAAKQAENACWASGELSAELIKEYYPEYSKAAIRKTVGEIYSISINTVRDRERVAAAVPSELRNAVPYLKYSHWRNLISCGQKKADQMLWESVAMYEAEGKGPSVDQILAWRDNKTMDATPPWIYRLQTGLEKLEMIRDDPRSDPKIRLICEKAVTDLEARSAVIKLGRFQLKKGADK